MKFQEYETLSSDCGKLPCKEICGIYTAKLFNQTKPVEEEIEVVESSMLVNGISFESATYWLCKPVPSVL